MSKIFDMPTSADTSEKSNLCFALLDSDYPIHPDLVWKKYRVFSRAAELLLDKVHEEFGSSER